VSTAKKGDQVVVQRRTGAGVWLVEIRTHAGRDERFRATVNRSGLYRVRSGMAVGPAVRLK
jgi:nitrogen fixation protein FixH